jgi:hypothetical protein
MGSVRGSFQGEPQLSRSASPGRASMPSSMIATVVDAPLLPLMRSSIRPRDFRRQPSAVFAHVVDDVLDTGRPFLNEDSEPTRHMHGLVLAVSNT